MGKAAGTFFALITAVVVGSSGVLADQQPSGAGAKYQVVKVCSLLPLAEVKKLAPWAPHLDQFAKPEEEAIGPQGSSCNYPTAHIQVMAYRQSMIDTARKAGGLEPAAGVGDEAYVHNKQGSVCRALCEGRPAPVDRAVEPRYGQEVRVGEAVAHRSGRRHSSPNCADAAVEELPT